MAVEPIENPAGTRAGSGKTTSLEQARVLIVIVNYRTPELVVDALASLDAERRAVPGLRTVVVENGSGDHSASHLADAIERRGWSSWASLLMLPENLGFSGGNNAALRPELASDRPSDFCMLLNPDTVVRPGAIAALASFLIDHPRVGIVAGGLEEPGGTFQPTGHRLPHPFTQLSDGARLGLLDRLLPRLAEVTTDEREARRYGWVSGASMMIRREVLQQIGLLDEGYFLYFDDIDYCCRAGRGGWESWVLPTARILHLEGQATQIKVRGRRKPYWYAARRHFYLKNYGLGGLIAADLLWGLGRGSLVVRNTLGLGGDLSSDPLRLGWDTLWGDLKAILTLDVFKTRRRIRER